ncbi:unnamed protein product [Cladocopium goreaui]|uniref:Uncharacterized protein n=1 Tax=Cladocopium goreaui TaxID=2562237 RepID=A0A9P1C9N3_9DINO|nr:unnamed protein product [Cladocopium goreaui]
MTMSHRHSQPLLQHMISFPGRLPDFRHTRRLMTMTMTVTSVNATNMIVTSVNATNMNVMSVNAMNVNAMSKSATSVTAMSMIATMTMIAMSRTATSTVEVGMGDMDMSDTDMNDGTTDMDVSATTRSCQTTLIQGYPQLILTRSIWPTLTRCTLHWKACHKRPLCQTSMTGELMIGGGIL